MAPVFKLTDNIETDYTGFKQLTNFYHLCRDYSNTTIHLDFYDLTWVDANLCSLFNAILYKLHKEQNLTFAADMEFVRSKFDILFRNGFLSDGNAADDVQRSAVPNEQFAFDDKDGFCGYIREQLMKHRGMPWMSSQIEEQIQEDLLEIFCNSHHHANTKEPFFIAGQYYPKLKTLKLTMVDLGDGFLPRINTATEGQIKTDLDAILWTLSGNSTKLYFDQTPGSLGLTSIYKYVQANHGNLDIISGHGYWSSSFDNTLAFRGGRLIPTPFVGTTINLFFRQ
jgi:hypothetical protein